MRCGQMTNSPSCENAATDKNADSSKTAQSSTLSSELTLTAEQGVILNRKLAAINSANKSVISPPQNSVY